MMKPFGNLLKLLRLREIRSQCLVFRAAQAKSQDYQAVLKVDPVNLLMLADREQQQIVAGFRDYLASLLPQDGKLCIHVRIREEETKGYRDLLSHTAQTHPQDCYREMARSHLDFLDTLEDSQALLTRECYVRVGVIIPGRTSEALFAQARAALDTLVEAVTRGLSNAGLEVSRLDDGQLVQYVLSCIHSEFARTSGIPQSVLDTLPSVEDGPKTDGVRPGRWRWFLGPKRSDTIPDRVTLPELLQPSSVSEKPDAICVHQETDEYLRGRAVIAYPATLAPGWFEQLLALDVPAEVLLFIGTLDSSRYVRNLSRKLTNLNATALLEERRGKTPDPYVAAARTEIEEMRDQLVSKQEQVHEFSLYVISRGTDEDTLRHRDSRVAQVLKGLSLAHVALQYEHLHAWLSLVNGRDLLRRERKLDTSTVATAMPFCASELSTEPGAMIGLTPSGGMVLINPTSPQLENGHQLVFAKSGSGKSFFEKLGLMRQLLLGMSGIVIDPDNEFRRICVRFGGSQIDLSPESLQINPFDLVAEETLTEKVQRLLTLFDLLLADKQEGVLTNREKSYLHQILMQAYHNQGGDASSEHYAPPHMGRVYDLLVQAGDEFDLAARLARYLHLFPERTEVELDNQLVVFNIRDLGDRSKELLRIGLFVITDYVWSTVRRESTPHPRLLLLDEAWVLAETAEGGQFLADLSRRARKYNLHLRLITQHVGDFLTSHAGQTLLGNCAMKMLLHHEGSALDMVARAFELTSEERRFLLTARKGEGLFFCRKTHVPLLVVASDEEYQLATTDPSDLLEAQVDAGERSL